VWQKRWPRGRVGKSPITGTEKKQLKLPNNVTTQHKGDPQGQEKKEDKSIKKRAPPTQIGGRSRRARTPQKRRKSMKQAEPGPKTELRFVGREKKGEGRWDGKKEEAKETSWISERNKTKTASV